MSRVLFTATSHLSNVVSTLCFILLQGNTFRKLSVRRVDGMTSVEKSKFYVFLCCSMAHRMVQVLNFPIYNHQVSLVIPFLWEAPVFNSL